MRVSVWNSQKFTSLKTHGLNLSIAIFSLVLFFTPSSPQAQENSGAKSQAPPTPSSKSNENPRFFEEREASIAITADELREDRERQRVFRQKD